MTPEQAAALRAPFPQELIGKLPKGRTMLDYVGHGAVTDRLLQVDSEWRWEPLATTPEGLPVLDRNERGQPIGLWIKLTVAGVTRIGYGSVEPGSTEAVKQLIGDALRNAAMRFGVGLDLWVRGDPDAHEEPSRRETPAPSQEKPKSATALRAEALGLTTRESRAALAAWAKTNNMSVEDALELVEVKALIVSSDGKITVPAEAPFEEDEG